MSSVIIDSKSVNYIKSGKGKTVVLIHGWGDSARTFASLRRSLESHFSVIAVDLPGFGGSEAPVRAYDLSDYASFIQNLLSKVGAHEVDAVIGHSNGGAVAIKAIADDKVRPKKLILLASSGIRNKSIRKIILQIFVKMTKPVASLLPDRILKRIKKNVYSSIGSDYLVAGHLQESFKLVVAEDVRGAAANVSVPCLLMYGGSDKLTPYAYGEILASSIPESTLIEVVGAGHMLHQSHADEIERSVLDFIKG